MLALGIALNAKLMKMLNGQHSIAAIFVMIVTVMVFIGLRSNPMSDYSHHVFCWLIWKCLHDKHVTAIKLEEAA